MGRKWRQSDVISGRFWCKIRVYKNRSVDAVFSFQSFFSWNDVELIGLLNCCLRFSKLWKEKKTIWQIVKKYFWFLMFCFVFKNSGILYSYYKTHQNKVLLKILVWYIKMTDFYGISLFCIRIYISFFCTVLIIQLHIWACSNVA